MAISLFGQSGTGSAWREMETWRAKQKQFAADSEAVNATLSSTLMTTFSSSNDGMIELTVRKALAAARQRAGERAKLQRLDMNV